MLKGSRSFLAELAEQPFIGIGEFDEGNNGYKIKGFFDKEHQWVSQQQQYTVDEEVVIHAAFKLKFFGTLHKFQRKISDTGDDEHP